MKKNNILKISVIVMLITALVSMSSLFAEASNHEDKDWKFQVGAYGKNGYIAEYGREKHNDTGVYIK